MKNSKKRLNKQHSLNKKTHIASSELRWRKVSRNFNIIYDNIHTFDTTNTREVKINPDYSKCYTRFNKNNTLIFNIHNICVCILIVLFFVVLLYMLVRIHYLANDCSNITNNTVNFSEYTDTSNKVSVKYYTKLNSISTNFDTKSNIIKHINFQQPRPVNTNFDQSVILNKIRYLHLKENVLACNEHNNKIMELEMQINNNKKAYLNLMKDIDSITKEFKPANHP